MWEIIGGFIDEIEGVDGVVVGGGEEVGVIREGRCGGVRVEEAVEVGVGVGEARVEEGDGEEEEHGGGGGADERSVTEAPP